MIDLRDHKHITAQLMADLAAMTRRAEKAEAELAKVQAVVEAAKAWVSAFRERESGMDGDGFPSSENLQGWLEDLKRRRLELFAAVDALLAAEDAP